MNLRVPADFITTRIIFCMMIEQLWCCCILDVYMLNVRLSQFLSEIRIILLLVFFLQVKHSYKTL